MNSMFIGKVDSNVNLFYFIQVLNRLRYYYHFMIQNGFDIKVNPSVFHYCINLLTRHEQTH